MTPNRTICPSCGAGLKTTAQPGRRIRCPKCGTAFEVPEEEPDVESPSRSAKSRPKLAASRSETKGKPVPSKKEERSHHEQEDEPEERPRKSKRKSKRAAKRTVPLWTMIGGGVLLFLLAMVTVLALTGVFSRKPPEPAAGSPQASAAAIDPVSAFLAKHRGKIDRKGTDIVGLELVGAKISDSDLDLLKNVRSLRQLRLDDTAITDAGLEPLKQLTQLEALSIVDTKVTESGARDYRKAVPGCTISWSRDDLTNAMINAQDNLAVAFDLFGATVRETDGQITWVDLGRKKRITDEGLRHLKGLTQLTFLGVYGETGRLNDITDGGLAQIKEFKSLENLNTGWTKITDAGLVHLKELPKLKYLDLRYTDITDAGLEHLKGMKTLEQIGLGGAKGITPAGVENLRQHLPGCNILAR
jgi:hypothetical protein